MAGTQTGKINVTFIGKGEGNQMDQTENYQMREPQDGAYNMNNFYAREQTPRRPKNKRHNRRMNGSPCDDFTPLMDNEDKKQKPEKEYSCCPPFPCCPKPCCPAPCCPAPCCPAPCCPAPCCCPPPCCPRPCCPAPCCPRPCCSPCCPRPCCSPCCPRPCCSPCCPPCCPRPCCSPCCPRPCCPAPCCGPRCCTLKDGLSQKSVGFLSYLKHFRRHHRDMPEKKAMKKALANYATMETKYKAKFRDLARANDFPSSVVAEDGNVLKNPEFWNYLETIRKDDPKLNNCEAFYCAKYHFKNYLNDMQQQMEGCEMDTRQQEANTNQQYYQE